MAKRDEERGAAMPALDMTPMIDCTFNLLIFFLCNINFRALEGKLPAFLPRDVGVNSVKPHSELEPLEIRVDRTHPAAVRDPQWSWRFDQIVVRVQGKRVESPEELARVLETVRRAEPGGRAVLRMGRGSLYIDAVKVLDECLRARLLDVAFAGVSLDA